MRRTIRLGWALLAAGTLAAAALAVPGPSVAASAASSTVNPYIVNGSQISISQVPFQAAILDTRFGTDRVSQFECGGSVLTPHLVVTAGHCTYYDLGNGLQESPANLRVLVDTDDLSTGGTVVGVSAIHRNPGYDPTKSDRNDIALLTLSAAVSTAPVSVVPSQSDYRWIYGAHGFVSGWGCDDANSDCRAQTDYPLHLRGASLTVHTNSYCASRYMQYSIDFDPATMLCAGDPSLSNTAPGPCFGDSGGPLTVGGYQGKRLLIGLVSWGVVCGGESTAFTRVATYRSWLHSYGVPLTPPPLTPGPTRQLLADATPIVGDFNGDGIADFIAYRPGSATDALYRNINGSASASALALNGDYHAAACDQTGEGRDDLMLVAPGTAPDYLLIGQAGSPPFVSKQMPALNANYTPVAGDFNGDGHCDLLLYQPGSGPDHMWLANNAGTGTFNNGPPIDINGNYIPIAGDFNGDGRADVLWYAPGSGTDYLRLGKLNGTFANGATVAINGTYVPVAGDFNGDHRTDVLWFGPDNAIDSLWYSNGTGFTQGPDVTVAGDYTPRAGDFNNDGKADVAWMSSSGSTTIWLGK